MGGEQRLGGAQRRGEAVSGRKTRGNGRGGSRGSNLLLDGGGHGGARCGGRRLGDAPRRTSLGRARTDVGDVAWCEKCR